MCRCSDVRPVRLARDARRTLGGVFDENVVLRKCRCDTSNAGGALNENAAAVAIARVVCRQVAHAVCDGLPIVAVVRAGIEVNIVVEWALRRVLRPGGVDDAWGRGRVSWLLGTWVASWMAHRIRSAAPSCQTDTYRARSHQEAAACRCCRRRRICEGTQSIRQARTADHYARHRTQ